MNNPPSFADIESARDKIRKYIHKTPVLTCESINTMVGAQLYFKCENFQKVGAFKFRGACNAVFSLSENAVKNGVATHSSGNHAQALALAARMRGVAAYIVMPRTSPEVKKAGAAGYGAQITFCEPTLKAREESVKAVIAKTDAALIHPYDNDKIIAGQGTSALELMRECDFLDTLIAPIGGGGLMSGTSIVAKHLQPAIEVIGCEPSGADDAFRSVQDNKLYPPDNPKSIADGLLASLSERTFSIIKKNVDKIVTVDDDEIRRAMKVAWERMKIVIEPSAAVALAALLSKKHDVKGRKVGVIISGGNVDFQI
jgi:threonine dehydratase